MADSFTTLVSALASSDNAARTQAEEQFKQLKMQNPTAAVTQLTQLIRSSPDAGVRAFAPVLLRPLLESTNGVYMQLDANTQTAVKSELLEAITSEPDASVRRKLSHLIAELASTVHANQQAWPELMTVVSSMTSHQDPLVRALAFELLAKLSEYVGDMLTPHKESFLTVFTNALNDSSPEVQAAALRAAAGFLLTLDGKNDLAAFGVILQPMLRVIESLLKTDDEPAFREVLSTLVQLAEIHPTFFRSALDDVSRAFIYVCSADSLDAETRELALEFLLSLCENAGGMMRKSSVVTTQLVPLVLQLMCEVEDDEQWVNKFDDPETFREATEADEDNSLSEAASAAIDRLSSSLGGASVLPVAIPVIEKYLKSADWRHRRAALLATCLVGEGAKSLMTQELDNVMQMVLPYLEDAHPRVQYATLHCLGQLAEDFGEVDKGKNFQARYHSVVLPALTTLLQKQEVVMRTKALAASVAVNFCNTAVCKKKHVAPYSQELLEALFNVLRSSPKQVQEQAITAVASIAKVIGDDFERFYDIFIPLAKDVLVHAVGKDYSLLRGKAMESIALIGQAVGKQRFVQDAPAVMDLLLQVQSSEELQGPEVQYVAQSCVRIGSVLKEDFVPYLSHVVPALMKQAQIEPDITLTDLADDEEEDDENGTESLTIDVRGGRKRLHINTSALEEKTNACNMLYQSAVDLQGAFYPYVNQVTQVLLPLINFEYVEDVRVVSSLALAKLLHCVWDGQARFGQGSDNPQHAQQFFEQCFDPLVSAMQAEEDLECVGAFAEATSALLEECYEASKHGVQCGVPLDHVPRAVEIFLGVAGASAQRLFEQQQANQQDEDFDAHTAEQQGETIELEEGLFRSMVDSVGYLIKLHQDAFVPIFKSQIQPFITPLLESSNQLAFLRGQAICVLDDIVEHCANGAQDLLPSFQQYILVGLEEVSTPSVVQAAAYGIGTCAVKAGPAFDSVAQQALEKLAHVISGWAATDDDEALAARDNAISAVGKICAYRENQIDAARIWAFWLSCLPLQVDVLEAQDVHARLVSLVESGNTHVLGAEYANLPQIFKIFAAVLAYDPTERDGTGALEEEEDMAIITEESKAKLRDVLSKLQTQLPGPSQSAFNALSTEEQQALSKL